MNSILDTKLTPQNIEAEESLLSALMIHNEYIHECDNLKPKHFYKTAHQKIYDSYLQMFKKNQTIDIITTVETLSKNNTLQEVGGASYVSRLVDMVPMSVNIEQSLKIILDNYILRTMIVNASEILNMCYDKTNELDNIIDSAQKKFMNIETNESDEFTHIKDLSNQSLDRYEEQYERQKEGFIPGIRTGFRNFDNITGGFSGPEFIIISGRPGMGKTSFMLSLIKNQCEAANKVGCISMEMSKEKLDDRLCAMVSGINTMKLSQGHGPKSNEWTHINKAAGKKSEWQLLINDTGAMHISKLKRCVRKLVKLGCEIVYIDQLSFIRGDSDRFTNATTACNELAMLKKDVGVPIILLAQLNRNLENRNIKEPQLSDLKNTGSLEEDADKVFLIHRPGKYDTKIDGSSSIINLAKNRDGSTWRNENIEFKESITLFRDKGY